MTRPSGPRQPPRGVRVSPRRLIRGRWRRGALFGAAGVLLLASGCAPGGSPGGRLSGDERAAADAMADEAVTSGLLPGGPVSAQAARCVADGAVTDVGLDRLQRYGVVTDDLKVDRSVTGVRLDPEDASALAAVLVRCLDVERGFERTVVAELGGRALTRRARSCLRRAVDADLTRQMLARALAEGPDAVPDQVPEDLPANVRGCVTGAPRD